MNSDCWGPDWPHGIQCTKLAYAFFCMDIRENAKARVRADLDSNPR